MTSKYQIHPTSYLLVFLAVLVFGQTFPVPAQEPYDASWSTDTALLTAGTGVLGAGFYLNARIARLTEEEVNALTKDDVIFFDRIACSFWSPKASKMSDILRDVCLYSPLSLVASENVRKNALVPALMYVETIVLVSAASVFTKSLVRRVRPAAYNPEVPLSYKTGSRNVRKSFYSGHTTLAFSGSIFFAKVYSDYHPESNWTPYIWGSAIGLSSLTGILRIISGKHFPTDVAAGAITGMLAGYLVPKLHEQNSSAGNKSGSFQIMLRFAF